MDFQWACVRICESMCTSARGSSMCVSAEEGGAAGKAARHRCEATSAAKTSGQTAASLFQHTHTHTHKHTCMRTAQQV